MESQQNIQQQRMDIEKRIKKLQERLKSRGDKAVASLPKQITPETGILSNNRNTINVIPNAATNQQKQYNLREHDSLTRNFVDQRVESRKAVNQMSFAYNQGSKYNQENYENTMELRRSPEKAVIRKNHNVSYQKLSSIPSRSGEQFLTSKLQPERVVNIIREDQQTKVIKKNYPHDYTHEIKINTMPVSNYNRPPSNYLSGKKSSQRLIQPYNRDRVYLDKVQPAAKNQLYDMMKMIMEGQRKLEDQIRNLKNNYKNSNQSQNILSKYSYQRQTPNLSYKNHQIRQNKPYETRQQKKTPLYSEKQIQEDTYLLQQKEGLKDSFCLRGTAHQKNEVKNIDKSKEPEGRRKSNLKQKKQNQQEGRTSIRSPYSNNDLVNRYRKSASNVCDKQRKARFVQYTDQTHQQESILNNRYAIDQDKSINNKKQENITRAEFPIQSKTSFQRNTRAVSAKTKFTRMSKRKQGDNFSQLLHIARMSKSANERIKISQECKDNIWHKVESRMKQSQKQYFEPLKKTNKHEHQNLIGTLQLQKKLKQQLIGKVYQKCNHYAFK